MTCSSSQILAVAQSQVGYKETGSDLNKYGVWYGMDGVAWCDIFVSWCAAQAGGADVVGRFSYCPDHVAWFKSRGQWGTTPRVGAIVFFNWNGGTLAQHVGIVKTPGATVGTIEGNCPDGVYERSRQPGQIIGYGYPAYSDAPTSGGTDPSTWGGGYSGTPTLPYPYSYPPAVQNITLVSASQPVVSFHGV